MPVFLLRWIDARLRTPREERNAGNLASCISPGTCLLLCGFHMVHSGIVRAFGGYLRQALAIGNAEIKDNLTGQRISIEVGPLYVRLSVDARDYYFDRITGRFDGTGAAR